MTRKPIYHKRDHTYRVVSRPNDLWVAQHYDAKIAPSNERDAWHDLGSAATLEGALNRMRTACPTPERA